MSDDLSQVLDDAYPRCPTDGTRLEEAGSIERPRLQCPSCGLAAI